MSKLEDIAESFYQSDQLLCAGHLIGSTNGTTTTYYLTDAQGSVLTSLSASAIVGQQVYGPYGNTRYQVGSMGTTKGYTGQFHDAVSGLDYYHARYYDPVIGQFLSVDEKQGNVQGADPYSYVAGNPETMSDPTGSAGVCAWCAETGIAGGSAAASGYFPISNFFPPSRECAWCADTGIVPGSTAAAGHFPASTTGSQGGGNNTNPSTTSDNNHCGCNVVHVPNNGNGSTNDNKPKPPTHAQISQAQAIARAKAAKFIVGAAALLAILAILPELTEGLLYVLVWTN